MSGRSPDVRWNPPTSAEPEIRDPCQPDPGGATAHTTACRSAGTHPIVGDASGFVKGAATLMTDASAACRDSRLSNVEIDTTPANGSGDQADAPRPPTIKDVARLAGVSFATVSRVLNADPHVREETRLQVKRAVALLGYERNEAAAQLRRGRGVKRRSPKANKERGGWEAMQEDHQGAIGLAFEERRQTR